MKQKRFHSFHDALYFVPLSKDRHELRNFNFMNDGQPPSVKSLAERLGFFVEMRKLPNGVSGYLETEPFAEKGFKIVVNQNHPVTRRRWTVLHEIAHFYLHPRFTDLFADNAYRASTTSLDHFYNSPDELIEEREANEWVEAITFEQNALTSLLSLHAGRKETVARAFGVSLQSLEMVIRKRMP